MIHISWHKNRCDPNHAPKRGDRVFIDSTPEISNIYNRMKVEMFWDHPEFPMKERYKTKTDAINGLSKEFQKGQPYIITV